MLLIILLLFFEKACSQQSPLNINNNQIQLIGFIPDSTLNIMNFTARFPIVTSYSVIFRFRRIDLTDDNSYLYLNFTATASEPIVVK